MQLRKVDKHKTNVELNSLKPIPNLLTIVVCSETNIKIAVKLFKIFYFLEHLHYSGFAAFDQTAE